MAVAHVDAVVIGAGVVGLQECSVRVFRDLTAGLSYGLPPGKLDQPESQPGLAGYHWADFVAADSKDEALASDTGLAAFVRTDTWTTVAVHARFLRERLFGSRVSGRLRMKLKTQSDAVLLLLLDLPAQLLPLLHELVRGRARGSQG